MSFVPPPPEPESLPGPRIALGVAASLVGVALCLLLARFWELHSMPADPAPQPAVGAPEVSRVFQRPFALETSAKRSLAEQRAQLGQYGWVDRERGVISIPIDRAMESVVASEPKP
jgi:hypothetical protein